MTSFTESLYNQGWVKIESVLTDKEADELAELARHHALAQVMNAHSPTTTDVSMVGKLAPRKLSEPFFVDSRFRKFLFGHKIISLVKEVLGEYPVLIFDHVFMKPALFGSRKFWHQDGFYYDLDDVNKGISVWVALCDADKNNGCMEYYSGSHKKGLCKHIQPNDEPAHAAILTQNISDHSTPVMVPAKKGDVILHHFHTIHGSGQNISDNDRIAYASHWISADTNGSGASWNKIYSLRKKYHELLAEEMLYNM